jgi:hypothetical protein
VIIQHNDQTELFHITPGADFTPQTLRNRFSITSSSSLVLIDTDGYDVIIDSTLAPGSYTLYSKSPSPAVVSSASSKPSSSVLSFSPARSTPSHFSAPSHSSSSTSFSKNVSSSSSLSEQDSKAFHELKDKMAIIEVIDSLSHSIDNGDWKKWNEIFDDTVTQDFKSLTGAPSQTSPRDELIARWRETLGLYDGTQHMITNHLITLRGDTADVTSHAQTTTFLAPASEKDDWINRGLHGQEYATVTGKFYFNFKRTKEGWRLNGIKLVVLARHGNKDLLQVALRNKKSKLSV